MRARLARFHVDLLAYVDHRPQGVVDSDSTYKLRIDEVLPDRNYRKALPVGASAHPFAVRILHLQSPRDALHVASSTCCVQALPLGVVGGHTGIYRGTASDPLLALDGSPTRGLPILGC